MAGHFPDKPEVVLDDALAVKAAILSLGGLPKAKIAKELSISTSRLDTLIKRPEFINTLRKLEAEAFGAARVKIRVGVAKLADKILKVLEQHLDDGNLKAVMPTLKVLKLLDDSPEQADTSITVILPTSNRPINVTPKKDSV